MEVVLPLLIAAAAIGLVVASSDGNRRGPRAQRVAKVIRWTMTGAVVGLFALIAAFFVLLLVMAPIPV